MLIVKFSIKVTVTRKRYIVPCRYDVNYLINNRYFLSCT